MQTLSPAPSVAAFSASDEASSSSSSVPQQRQRLYVLDFIRLVAMLFMMQGHTISALASPEALDLNAFPWNIWNFVRGLTAPIFLMVSGAVHVFANKRNEQGRVSGDAIMRRLRWAITVMGIGYLMVFPASNIFDLQFVAQPQWDSFFAVNILQLSGSTLILLMALFAISRSTKQVARLSVATGLLIACSAPIINGIDWYNVVPEWLAAYLSYQRRSLFPIFPFASYMFFGVAIGSFLQQTPAELRLQRLTRMFFTWGVPLIIGGLFLTQFAKGIYPQHDYHLSSPFYVMIRVGISFLWMGALSVMYRYTRRFEEHYSLLGKRSLYVYVIHLVLLYGCAFFDGFDDFYAQQLTIAESILAAIAVIGGSLGCIYLYEFVRKSSFHVATLMRYSSVGVAFYLLFL